VTDPVEIVHACPPGGEWVTPCCGRSPHELPFWASRITRDPALVTCRRGLGHNYLMPHNHRFAPDDPRHCPPNCPALPRLTSQEGR
jgi:hypothetical protein